MSVIKITDKNHQVYWEKIRCPLDQLSISQPSVLFDLKASADLTDLSDAYWSGKAKLMKQAADGTWTALEATDKARPPYFILSFILSYPILSQFIFILGGTRQQLVLLLMAGPVH